MDIKCTAKIEFECPKCKQKDSTRLLPNSHETLIKIGDGWGKNEIEITRQCEKCFEVLTIKLD